jgi:hypothetical protein
MDDALGIAVDSSGNAFVTGFTQSSDFPVSPTRFQSSLLGTQNVFLAELNAAGSSLIYSTYLGGSGFDSGLGIALDANDNAFITGQTSSADFPVASAIQGSLAGSTDAFVSELSPGSNTLVFSTYLGGSGDEDQVAGSIAFNGGNIYVTGDTDSGNGATTHFPTHNALDGSYGGGLCVGNNNINVPCPDGFVTVYSTP